MARTIGRVEFNVDFDGKGLPARAKQIGEEAGKEMGKGASKGFDDETSEIAKNLRQKMRENGDLAGSEFERGLNERLKRKSAARSDLLQDVFGDKKGFDNYAKNFDSPIAAIDNLRNELKLLKKDGLIQDDTFKGLNNDLTVLRREAKKSETALERQRLQTRRNEAAFHDLDEALKRTQFDRQTRQIDGFRKQLSRLDTSLEVDRDKFDRLRAAADRMDWDGNRKSVSDLRGELVRVGDEFSRVQDRFDGLGRQLGRDGAVAGHAWGNSVRKAVRMDVDGVAKDLRTVFEDGDDSIRKHIRSYDNLGDGVDVVRKKIRLLRSTGNLPDRDFLDMATALRRVSESENLADRGFSRLTRRFRVGINRGVTDGVERLRGGLGRLGKALRVIDGPGRAFRKTWASAPHGLKQGAFYVGLFAGLAPGIATLGSVAGSSLAVLATGALAVGAAIGVTIAAFKGIGGPIEDVAPLARDSAKALATLSDPLHDLQQVLQGQLFKNLGDELRDIGTKLIPGVTDGLGGVADAVGDVFEQLLQGLESKGGIRTMNDLLEGFKPIIKDLGGAFLQLSAAFAHIFVLALPSAQGFFKFLNDLFTRFNDWTKSVEGQERIKDFFETLNILAEPLGDLIGAAGKALAGMVTDQTIGNMKDFLGTMTDVLDDLPDLVGVIDDLDPLGVVADALKAIFGAISDNKDGLGDLASDVGGFLKSGIKDLAPILSDVIAQLIPFGQAVADDLGPVWDDLLPVIKKIAEDTLPKLLDVLVKLAPAIPPIVDGLSDLASISLDNLDGILGTAGDLAGVLSALVPQDDDTTLRSYFQGIEDALEDFVGGIPAIFAKDPVGKALQDFGHAFDRATADLGDIIIGFFAGIGSAIGDAFISSFESGSELGGFLIDGIITGITDAVDTQLAGLKVVGDAIVNWFKDFFGIHSPSTLMRDVIGAFIVPGIIQGIVSNIADLGTAIFTNLSSAIDTGVTALAGLPGKAGAALGSLAGGIGAAVGSIPGIIGGAFGRGKDAAVAAKGTLLDAWNQLPPDVQQKLLSIPNIIGEQFRGAIVQTNQTANRIIDGVATLPGRAGNAATGAAKAISDKFEAAPGTVAGIVSNIVGKFSGITGKITGAIGDIAGSIKTKFNGIVSSVQTVVGNIVGSFSGLGDRILGTIGDIAGKIGSKLNFSGAVTLPKTATGGVFNGSQARIIGEAGPEAVVPLNRPLNQVDPAVRALSAYAQGLSTPGVSGVGRSVTVHEGAIQVVTPLSNPALVAEQVLDRLVASIG